jgi:Domain of unknown function (DUF1707)
MSSPVDPDAMRAANADRERVVAQLNEAFAEGRLEVGELDERVSKAYAAKTMGELKPLTVDLPPAGTVARRSPSPVPEAVAGRGVARRGDRADARMAVAGMTGIFVLNVVIWGVISLAGRHVIYFWPVWILIPLGLAVVRAIATHANRDT